jgi:hypothetical protein
MKPLNTNTVQCNNVRILYVNQRQNPKERAQGLGNTKSQRAIFWSLLASLSLITLVFTVIQPFFVFISPTLYLF